MYKTLGGAAVQLYLTNELKYYSVDKKGVYTRRALRAHYVPVPFRANEKGSQRTLEEGIQHTRVATVETGTLSCRLALLFSKEFG